MKKNYLIIAAIASVALASCSNDEYFGDPGGLTGDKAISFDMSTPAMTRAEGAEAAEKLGYSFQVYATKTVSGTTSNVFAHNALHETSNDPYWAWYEENTAGKTNSNLNNWEYVGGEGNHGKNNAVTLTANQTQTIKYWDKSATSYTFVAFKAKGGTISNVTTNGFTVSGTPAQLEELYVANKEIINKTDDAADKNKYGSPVKFTFRNFTSKIRFGIYEMIPGYSVKIKNVYYSKTGLTDGCSSSNFGVDGKFSGSSTEYIYNVTYDANNIAQGEYSSGEAQGYFETASSPILSETSIGTSTTTATYDKTVGEDKKAYTVIMPNPGNTTGMTLKIDITLTSEGGSGETIELKGASATVPANFCQWQSNYAYTYLFKISDLTEFQVGDHKELLCPITLDAVVVDNGQGEQNTITVIEEPSITTYQNGAYADDYYASNGAIFATVEEANGTLKTLTTGSLETVGNASLFTISHATQTNFTEAEIEKALLVRTSGLNDATVIGRNGITLAPTELTLTDKIGTKNFGANKVATFTPTAGNYAFVYTVTGSSDAVGYQDTKYEAVPGLNVGDDVAPYFWYYKYVTSVDAIEGATYYTRGGSGPNYTYTAVTTPPTFFLGQKFATGLYTKDGNTYTLYTDYVKSDGTYYLTDGAENAVATITYQQCIDALSATNNSDKIYSGTSTNDAVTNATAITVDGTYYKLTGGDGSDASHFTRCIIMPEQINNKESVDYYRLVTSETIEKCPAGEKATTGKRYYEQYTMYKGKYAVKVIKVQ